MVTAPYRRTALAALAAGLAVVAAAAGPGRADPAYITVASTTSTENSGLFERILPAFEDRTGIDVRVVAVGTGQAIEIARRGDADVLFVHHTPSEEAFVAAGYGIERLDVMYNDFVIVGPATDPAGIRAMTDAPAALARIASARAVFVSRGDDSGTHLRELSLWAAAGVDPTAASGRWYRETGSGMGAALNTGSALGAYVLTDRGTWISFANKGDLDVLVAGDERLVNQYGVVPVDPQRHPHVKADLARAFVDWLISDEGQAAIAAYRVDGDQLFFPNAR